MANQSQVKGLPLSKPLEFAQSIEYEVESTYMTVVVVVVVVVAVAIGTDA